MRSGPQPLSLILFVFSFFPQLFWGQTIIEGSITDGNTGQALPFANVVYQPEKRLGATADLNGNFRIQSPQPIQLLRITYIGYQPLWLAADTIDFSSPLRIRLFPNDVQVEEVLIAAERNPALGIIRKVIANKKRNNPEKVESFTYESYQKILVDFLTGEAKDHKSARIDTNMARMRKFSDMQHLMVMETVSERKFLFPDRDEESIIASKVSGLQNPTFGALATDFQPFSFYKEIIPLYDREFINPIANGSLRRYDFRLQDTIYQAEDTVYVISFSPKKGRVFDALTGLLYVNTFHYALQNVIAKPFRPGTIDLSIEQAYTCIDRKQWFPEQLHFEMLLREYPSPELGLRLAGKSYLRNIRLDTALAKKNFALESVRMAEGAGKKDSLFWKAQRYQALTQKEETTYAVIDSLGKKMKLDWTMQLMNELAKGVLPIGPVHFDLGRFYRYNEYEGNRWGLGVNYQQTPWERLNFYGYGAYGSRDRSWKYGGGLDFLVHKSSEFRLGFDFAQDLIEPGLQSLSMERDLSNPRTFLTARMDSVQKIESSLSLRLFRFLTVKVAGRKGYRQSTDPDYRFLPESGIPFQRRTNLTEAEVRLRFAFRERFVQTLGQRVSTGTSFPILELQYTRGLNVWRGELEYDRIEASIQHDFRTKKWGNSRYRLQAGLTNGGVPLSFLFFHSGAQTEDLFFWARESFQTMGPYDFLSDRFVEFFWEQRFSRPLYRSAFSQPTFTLTHAAAWGDLRNPEAHQGIDFQTIEKGYYEAGAIVDQILRMKFSLAYIGIGVGGFYRYGPYHRGSWQDNVAFKLSLSVSTD
ncbi:MAG: DUF5686 family protein [Bacteroidota bacterium]